MGRKVVLESGSSNERWHLWLEFWPSAVGALAVVLTAYCAYQATGWNGEQETELAAASVLRSLAGKATSVGSTQILYDASGFSALTLEFRNEDLHDPAVLAEALRLADRLLWDEAKVAMAEWLRMDPFNDPGAPRSPLEVPGYANASMEEADSLMARAEEVNRRAEATGAMSDSYVLGTVLFATVLFFTGLKVKSYWGHVVVAVLSTVFLLAGVGWLLTLPRV